jgi:DNA-binding transcriptional LysR family regulator
MIHSLLALKNEIAIIARVEEGPGIHFAPFSQEELVFIVAPDHPLARKKAIAFEELADEPIIMKEAGSGTRKLVNGLFAQKGLVPDVLMETSNAEFIKDVVQRKEGVAFLVKAAVAAELRDRRLVAVALREGQILLDVCIAYLKNQHFSPPARAFLDVLEELSSENKPLQDIGTLMLKILAKRRAGNSR